MQINSKEKKSLSSPNLNRQQTSQSYYHSYSFRSVILHHYHKDQIIFRRQKMTQGFLFQWNVPRLWCQILIPIFLTMSGHWLLLSINLPISIFLLRR